MLNSKWRISWADIQQEHINMENALVRLGLTEVAAREFTNNSITSLDYLRVLSQEALSQLIKQYIVTTRVLGYLFLSTHSNV
jgi:hypothetical protein